jgi:hypothetical protein
MGNYELGMEKRHHNWSQISTRFVTEYGNQFRNIGFNLNVILSQIFTKFVTK